MTISLTPQQRDVIRDAALTDLSVIGDITLAIQDGEWEVAKRHRRECEELMLPLDDLGWEPEQIGPVELTMPAGALLPVISRLLESQIAIAVDAEAGWVAEAATSHATCRALADIEAELSGSPPLQQRSSNDIASTTALLCRRAATPRFSTGRHNPWLG